MTKIVYNNCYGSFGLSRKGMERYAKLKGITLYPEELDFGGPLYWTSPESDPDRELLSDFRISRSDPALIQVVEELGTEANGPFAELKIRELPAGTLYRIHEYDGLEEVITQDEYNWSIA